MRVSEVLSGSVEQFLTLTPQIQDHLDEVNNPHKVTKSQIGLGNVTDDKQATDADFRSHTSAPVLAHPDGAVTEQKLANGAVSADKIQDGAVGNEKLQDDSITANRLEPTLRNLIKNKVDKEEGLGLSQNSFTDAEKAKLGAISVVDGESLAVDTASLLLKSEPLTLQKTGCQLVSIGERQYKGAGGFTELYAVQEERQYSRVLLAGKDTSGIYKVVSDSVTEGQRQYYGTNATVCHCVYEGMPYFGEMSGNQITITYYEGSTSTVWKTLTAGTDCETTLQDFFITDNRIVVVFTSGDTSYGDLYVESFTRQGVKQWQVITACHKRENYTDTTIYDRRFRRAVMDGEDVYVAPVLDTKNAHAALRINKDGEITGKYRRLTQFTGKELILQDISVVNGYLYGYFSNGYIAKFHTETGNMYRIYCDGGGFGTFKGLTVTRKEEVCLLAQNSAATVTRFFMVESKGIQAPSERVSIVSLATEVDGDDLLCRAIRGNIEFIGFDGLIPRGRIYSIVDTYSIL